MIELTIPADGYSHEVELVANHESLELTQDDDVVALTPSQAMALLEVLKKLVVVRPTFKDRLSDD